MTPTTAHAKGKQLEDWVVKRLKLSGLDNRAYRQKGSGNGLNKGDVWNDLGICFECKNTKKYPNQATFKQVAREGMGYQREVVVWHPPHKPLDESKVIISWFYFEELLKKAREPKMENPDRTTKWHLINLKNAINQVIKDLKQ